MRVNKEDVPSSVVKGYTSEGTRTDFNKSADAVQKGQEKSMAEQEASGRKPKSSKSLNYSTPKQIH